MQLSGAAFRRLIPAGAVIGVLVASVLASPSSLASSVNNCGVKGYGYHDHGKLCPNRPFPGRGEGAESSGMTSHESANTQTKVVAKHASNGESASATSATKTAGDKSVKKHSAKKEHARKEARV